MYPSRRLVVALVVSVPLFAPAARADDPPKPARGADELYWVPTLDQATAMAAATGRPIFLMGYSLVGDGTTYTKLSDAACAGVY